MRNNIIEVLLSIVTLKNNLKKEIKAMDRIMIGFNS